MKIENREYGIATGGPKQPDPDGDWGTDHGLRQKPAQPTRKRIAIGI